MKGWFIMEFKININSAKASEIAAKKAAEIAAKKAEEHHEEVQGIIDVVMKHVEKAMNNAEFRVTLSHREVTDQGIIAAALSDKAAEDKADVMASKDVLTDAISVLKNQGGFHINRYSANETHKLPYFTIEWKDPDDDSTK
jgi:isopentenyl diphosphate isomerase/L-lactate dehydrogenase-like FMN-dependent dehydrogenase